MGLDTILRLWYYQSCKPKKFRFYVANLYIYKSHPLKGIFASKRTLRFTRTFIFNFVDKLTGLFSV